MRIISGWLGGRNFASPRGHRTHPMSDKMRGAIFGTLGDIKGLTVLDVFAGSGALSFEAISRGATASVAIEVDKGAHATIQQNAEELGITNRVKSVRAFFSAWSARNQHETYDLVFADPPYDNIPFRDLKFLPRHLKNSGTLVLSWPGNERHENFDGLEIVKSRSYGDSQLVFYQRIS
ncbi:MAG: RsmD family RNA methyltransferase [Candidatus Saccharimonadales bacterium]